MGPGRRYDLQGAPANGDGWGVGGSATVGEVCAGSLLVTPQVERRTRERMAVFPGSRIGPPLEFASPYTLHGTGFCDHHLGRSVRIFPPCVVHGEQTGYSEPTEPPTRDRKSTRLNSSHLGISYAVFC